MFIPPYVSDWTGQVFHPVLWIHDSFMTRLVTLFDLNDRTSLPFCSWYPWQFYDQTCYSVWMTGRLFHSVPGVPGSVMARLVTLFDLNDRTSLPFCSWCPWQCYGQTCYSVWFEWQDVSSILFLVSLAEYNQTLAEDSTINRSAKNYHGFSKRLSGCRSHRTSLADNLDYPDYPGCRSLRICTWLAWLSWLPWLSRMQESQDMYLASLTILTTLTIQDAGVSGYVPG